MSCCNLTECSVCNAKALYTETQDEFMNSGVCLSCGFSFETRQDNLTLTEVNVLRKSLKLKPLDELRQDED